MIQSNHQDYDNGDDGTTEMPMGQRDDCAFFGFETAAEKQARVIADQARANPDAQAPVNLAADPVAVQAFRSAQTWKPLPEGWASVVISRAEWRTPQSGGPQYLHIRYSAPATITRQEDGVRIERGMATTQNLQVAHPTPNTKKASLNILAHIVHSAGLDIDLAAFTPALLHGACLDVEVAHRPDYRDRTKSMPVVTRHRSTTDV
jgi:hypothetical protein